MKTSMMGDVIEFIIENAIAVIAVAVVLFLALLILIIVLVSGSKKKKQTQSGSVQAGMYQQPGIQGFYGGTPGNYAGSVLGNMYGSAPVPGAVQTPISAPGAVQTPVSASGAVQTPISASGAIQNPGAAWTPAATPIPTPMPVPVSGAASVPEPVPAPKTETVAVPPLENTPREGEKTHLLFGAQSGAPEHRVTLTSMADPGRTYTCRITDRITVGRNAASCDIAISTDNAVSERHCEISYSDNRFYIRDIGSSNGTSVNGCMISSVTQLQPGYMVKIGRIEYRVTME